MLFVFKQIGLPLNLLQWTSQAVHQCAPTDGILQRRFDRAKALLLNHRLLRTELRRPGANILNSYHELVNR